MGKCAIWEFSSGRENEIHFAIVPGLICELTPAGKPRDGEFHARRAASLAVLAEMPREDEPLASRCMAEGEIETTKSLAADWD